MNAFTNTFTKLQNQKNQTELNYLPIRDVDAQIDVTKGTTTDFSH